MPQRHHNGMAIRHTILGGAHLAKFAGKQDSQTSSELGFEL